MLFFVFWVFLIQVFKERPLSLSWVPGDVALVARLSSNRRFFNEMVLYREWVREVEQPRQGQRGKRENTKSKSNEQTKLWTCSTLFGRFLCRHRTTDVVKLDRSSSLQCRRFPWARNFRPRTYRKGYYFYSSLSSTVVKSKMAATTILRTRTRFRPPKKSLHCRLSE